MTQERKQDAIYVVGDGERERQRLQNQGDAIRPFTRQLFENAGIRPGMRVLDVGCGMGDVALLAAEMVGPTGSVVGVDKNADVLKAARRRAPSNVSFQAGDIRTLGLDSEFDAVVGRAVLMYQQDAAETIASAIQNLLPGGIVAFQEPDFTTGGGVGVPQSLLQKQLWDWSIETFRRAGMEIHMGFKLRKAFVAAGLPEPGLQANSVIGGGPGWIGYRNAEDLFRSMLPLMESLGVTTADEVQIDTLAERLEASIVDLDGTAMFSTWIGAWTRKE